MQAYTEEQKKTLIDFVEGMLAMSKHDNTGSNEMLWLTCQIALAAMKARSDGWIKCSDRMPERHQFVIGYTEYDGVIYQMAVDDNGVWYTKDSDWSMTKVTHWMHQPAAPEIN